MITIKITFDEKPDHTVTPMMTLEQSSGTQPELDEALKVLAIGQILIERKLPPVATTAIQDWITKYGAHVSKGIAGNP